MRSALIAVAVAALLVGPFVTPAAAQMALRELIANAQGYDFEPHLEKANAALIRKTIAAQACLEVGEKALETAGGFGLLRELSLERLLRDLHGAQFHPLTAKRQQLLSGRLALGLEPVG
jgi:alkylation response protein AidB-like acyl-CoA dehydrogenase